MSYEVEIDEILKKVGRILTQEQVNFLYFQSCLKDIQYNKNIDDEVEYVPIQQYLTDILEVMEMKEEYELCNDIHQVLIKF